ncbi:MAG: DUF481 domain-containing protein [Xanthomonadales bacterium]
MNRQWTVFLLCLVALLTSPIAWAEKTDIVVLKNGDKITGEVKGLERGKLEFSTDSMGTVSIEWEDIQTVISSTGQAIELANGQRFYGPLQKSENTDMVQIQTDEGAVGLGITDVVNMYPVESGFWDRMDFSTSLGFSWDKASDIGKYSIGADAEYRHPDYITSAGFSSEITSASGDGQTTSRSNINGRHLRFRQNKRFTAWFANVEKNDELGIKLRALLGAGYGWVPIRSNRNLLMLTAGLDVNQEYPKQGDPETNVEGVGVLNYEYFKYSDPERRFSSTFTVFPSLTDWGRVRADFKTNLDIEFVSDFFWVLSLFANYDSRPISENASKSDFGVNSSLRYKF